MERDVYRFSTPGDVWEVDLRPTYNADSIQLVREYDDPVDIDIADLPTLARELIRIHTIITRPELIEAEWKLPPIALGAST